MCAYNEHFKDWLRLILEGKASFILKNEKKLEIREISFFIVLRISFFIIIILVFFYFISYSSFFYKFHNFGKALQKNVQLKKFIQMSKCKQKLELK